MPDSAQPDPTITPYLLYNDVAAALDWLARAFSLSEYGDRFTGPDGNVSHAAMRLGDGVVMMGCPGPQYRNPRSLSAVTQQLYVKVDDVDAHFARAKKTGAKILEELNDTFYGHRRYGAEDPEGHHWYFAQHIRDVSPEEMKRAMEERSDQD
jgi:PhnB protein